MGRGTGQAQGGSTSLLYGTTPKRIDYPGILLSRDQRLFVEVFGQMFCEELKKIAVERMEATFSDHIERSFMVIEPRRCQCSYRADVEELPELVEPDDDLIFTVYAIFPEDSPARGGLDRSSEVHFTPEEIAGLGWTSDDFLRRCREEVMEEGTGA